MEAKLCGYAKYVSHDEWAVANKEYRQIQYYTDTVTK